MTTEFPRASETAAPPPTETDGAPPAPATDDPVGATGTPSTSAPAECEATARPEAPAESAAMQPEDSADSHTRSPYDPDNPEWWRPIPPNALTLGNLLCGCAAIGVMAGLLPRPWLPTDAAAAAWFILLGGLFDGLDGRVARLLKTGSVFGKELDSLADMVTFGVAPGFAVAAVMHDGLGFAAGAVFICTAAIRLARFNVHADSPEAHDVFFSGLASPAAAVLLVCLVSLATGLNGVIDPGSFWAWVLPLVSVALGLLMISTIPYRYSGWKRWHLAMPLAAAVVSVFVVEWPKWLAFFAVGLVLYAASPPIAKAGKSAGKAAGKVVRRRRLPKFPNPDAA